MIGMTDATAVPIDKNETHGALEWRDCVAVELAESRYCNMIQQSIQNHLLVEGQCP